MNRPYWRRGEITQLARLARVQISRVSEILCRRKRCGGILAQRLRDATRSLGCEIPLEVWLSNLTTTHPAFRGQPSEE